MAETCERCKMLCVTFLLISSLSFVYSVSDYFYDVHSITNQHSAYTSIVFLDERLHEIHKRQTDEIEATKTPSNATEVVKTPETNVKPTYMPEKKITKVELEPIKKNLGVNGTGIRKNITRDDTVIKNKTATTVNVADATEPPKAVTTEETDDDLDIDKFSSDAINKSITENHVKVQYDHHLYYNSVITLSSDLGKKYWVEMNNRTDVKINELLSQSHRRAATIKLSFDFPFYGHIVRNVTIATGGFLYTGDYVHSWLAATQYIAPLMANFDTSLSIDSFIKFVDNGTALTVQWEKVHLQDRPQDGNFTFQATLHSNGDIVFVYQHVPMVIEEIQDDQHPVKVGLSDAYIIDRTIFFVRRKTIYEYHRVNFSREDIKNWTVIYLKALPTCLSNKDCVSCVSKPTSGFQCMWCSGLNRCSNGMDRNRQEWIMKSCDRKQINNRTYCSEMEPDRNNTSTDSSTANFDHGVDHAQREMVDNPRQESRVTNDINVGQSEKPVRMGISGIVSILFLTAIVAGLSVWVLYAYRNPHTTSGQILIRYRPSQWSWRRGEARYTAATIHM